MTLRTYLSFISCIEQTSHVSFRLDVCARCATMSATTRLVAENDRASILCLLASFSSVHSGRYWTICCKMGYTLLRVVLVLVFIRNSYCIRGRQTKTTRFVSVRRFCGDAASRQSHESIAQGSPVASVVLPAETHYAEGNVLLRLVDFGVATVATPGVCGSGELSGAVSEHCATNREEEIRTPDWKCNRSRLKVKWRRVRLGVAGRNRIRYGMVVE